MLLIEFTPRPSATGKGRSSFTGLGLELGDLLGRVTADDPSLGPVAGGSPGSPDSVGVT
jgi:hypothetical protein